MKKIIIGISLLLILCFATSSFGANGDIIAVRISGDKPGDGWVLQVDVESSGANPISTGGTYATLTSGNNVITAAAPVLTVTSMGFDSTGAAITRNRTVYGTYRMRKPFYGQSSVTLTSDGTNVSDGDTVTVDLQVYRFKSTMTQAYDVQIGADAATTLLNLTRAISGTGTAGTEFYTGTDRHATCYASETTITSTTLVIRAQDAGSAGDTITIAETSPHLSFSGNNLSGGTDYVEASKETLATGTLTLEIALSDYVWDKDTSVTATIAAGLYTQGGTVTGSFSGSVTNNSTLAYLQPVTNWDCEQRNLVTSSVPLSIVGMSNHPLNQEMLATVQFSCTDGAHNTSTYTLAGNAVTLTNDSLGTQWAHYAQTVDVSGLDDGVITCNYKAYPHYGDSDAVFDTAGTAPAARNEYDWLPHPIKFLKHAAGAADYGQAVAFVDPVNGQDSGGNIGLAKSLKIDGANYLTDAAARPFLTIENAIYAIGTYNTTNFSRSNVSNGIVYLVEGTHQGTGDNNAYASSNDTTWLTITKAPAATKENVIINTNSNSSYRSVSGNYIKIKDVTLARDANYYIFVGSAGSLWEVQDCTITDSVDNSSVFIYASSNQFVEFRRNTISGLGAVGPVLISIGNSYTGSRSMGYSIKQIGNVFTNHGGRYFIFHEPPDGNDGVICYNNKTTHIGNKAASWSGLASWTLGGMIANNLFEIINDHNGGFATMGGTELHVGNYSVRNLIFVNNNIVGARSFIAYDNFANILNNIQWLVAGNIVHYWAHKGDTFDDNMYGNASPDNYGSWTINFGVNHYGNVFQESSFKQEFAGINSVRLSVDAPEDLKYVDYQAQIDGTHPSETGGGDYHLQSDAPGINLYTALLPYDIEGNARSSGTYQDEAGCYAYISHISNAPTYYIDYVGGSDTNNGTSTATAFKHCPGDDNATGTAASTTLSAGDRVIFKGGVQYEGQINIMAGGSGDSDTQRIIYDGDSGNYAPRWAAGTDKAIIDLQGTIPSAFWWKGANADYITINNFILRNGNADPTLTYTSANSGRIIQAGLDSSSRAADYVNVSNCFITDAGNGDPLAGNITGHGIVNFYGSHWKIDNNTITDCYQFGIRMANGSYNKIYNNTFTGATAWPLNMTNNSSTSPSIDCEIYGNTLHDVVSPSGTGHHANWLWIFSGSGTTYLPNSGFTNLKIYSNKFYITTEVIAGATSGFIHTNVSRSEGTWDGLHIYGNVCFNADAVCISVSRSTGVLRNVYIYNNTHYSPNYKYFMNLGSVNENLYIYNNIMMNSDAISGGRAMAFSVPAESTVDGDYYIDYNLYNVLDDSSKKWLVRNFEAGTYQYYNFDEWQAAGYDTHPETMTSTTDPLFKNVTLGSAFDLGLQSSSPAIDKGKTLLAPTYDPVDILGTTRPSGMGWDIGAYESASQLQLPHPPTNLKLLYGLAN